MWLKIARMLPKKLRYWAAIDVIAYCTTGKYGHTIVPELTAMDALKRYGDDHFDTVQKVKVKPTIIPPL